MLNSKHSEPQLINDKKDILIKEQQQVASSSSLNTNKAYQYEIVKQVGQGTFGKVYEAKNQDNKRVAIKKVEKSNHFISREYDILKIVQHQNCLRILDIFYTSEENKKMQNLVFDFIPYTLANLLKKRQLSINFIRVLFYQLCQAIKHIHSKNICHRDITPNNILLSSKGELTLADFGSAKILEPNHTSMSYICSRYYRAPELLVGCSNYTTKIDIWSIGCILAEMLIGKPLFPGTNSNDQLGRIIEVLGSPTKEDMESMKPSKPYHLQLPNISPKFLDTLHNIEDKSVIDLLSKIFIFDPIKRASIEEIIAHPFLRDANLNNLELFDEMKCFSTNNKVSANHTSSSSSTTTISNMNSLTSSSSNNKTASESYLSRLNTSAMTSTNNLKSTDGKSSNSNNIPSLNNSNNGVSINTI
ncbi:hypothetical protein DICPUDRAFT_96328 [Dictyostelium purpureum]|uniref:Protein kinase domain-containing protein n=1 Tax=Dictyostelium purpureum TaxID=5786 RepID=F0Z7A0_DICPU|nr:uncharacterized protein DICPUDRAFT_96328 [Dictyostelium purpureum]EGC40225.1 hypothetical protein DICPUDRAFT_96328 [Dictyostelium purpureum]|eukprot:XP_003283294.1 hypothetical protein DICPUDRAFT_96328 [Dictyostelium purpureum]